MSSTMTRVCHISLALLVTLHLALSFSPRGPFRNSLTLVKRPIDGASSAQLAAADELEMALQADPELAMEWGFGRGYPDSSNYLGFMERLVKKKVDNADQPKRTGNRKFQTQGWR